MLVEHKQSGKILKTLDMKGDESGCFIEATYIDTDGTIRCSRFSNGSLLALHDTSAERDDLAKEIYIKLVAAPHNGVSVQTLVETAFMYADEFITKKHETQK